LAPPGALRPAIRHCVARQSMNLRIAGTSRVSHRRAMAAAVASNWAVGVDALLFVFILAPLTPPALWFLGSEPKFAQPSAGPQGTALCAAAKLVSDPNNQRGANTTFCRVFEQGKCTREGRLFVIARSPSSSSGQAKATRQSTATAMVRQHGLLRCARNDERGSYGFPVLAVLVPHAVLAGLSSAGARGIETKMFEPAGRVSESPPRSEQRKEPRSGPDCGCPFFRFPLFGHAKKGNSPAGAKPGSPRGQAQTRHTHSYAGWLASAATACPNSMTAMA